MEIWEKKQKDFNTNDSMREDRKPKSVHFEAGEDDCFGKLHMARFLRMPLCPRDEIWGHVPVEIVDKYKNLDLKSIGVDCQVSEKTILKMHNRREILQLKFFYPGNAGVSRGPMIETKVKSGNTVATVSDYNWANINNLKALRESIINFGLISQMLFPYDQSGYMFLKLYNNYHWLAGAGNDFKRVSLIQEHFNLIMEANASRACRREAPSNFDETERSLKRLLENRNLPSNPGALAEKGLEGEGGQRGQRRGLNEASANTGASVSAGPSHRPFQGQGREAQTRSLPPAGPKGKFVCYDFNNPGPGCTRQKSAVGCKDNNGKEYAHSCLFFDTNQKKYCFGSHSKQNHR